MQEGVQYDQAVPDVDVKVEDMQEMQYDQAVIDLVSSDDVDSDDSEFARRGIVLGTDEILLEMSNALRDAPGGRHPLRVLFGGALSNRTGLYFSSATPKKLRVMKMGPNGVCHCAVGSKQHRSWLRGWLAAIQDICPALLRQIHTHMRMLFIQTRTDQPDPSIHPFSLQGVGGGRLLRGDSDIQRVALELCEDGLFFDAAYLNVPGFSVAAQLLPILVGSHDKQLAYCVRQGGVVRQVLHTSRQYYSAAFSERVAPAVLGPPGSEAVAQASAKLACNFCAEDGAVIDVAGILLTLRSIGTDGDCLPAALSCVLQNLNDQGRLWTYVLEGAPYGDACKVVPELAQFMSEGNRLEAFSVHWLRMLASSLLTEDLFKFFQDTNPDLSYLGDSLEATRALMLDPAHYWGCDVMLQAVADVIGLKCLVGKNGVSTSSDSFYNGLEGSHCERQRCLASPCVAVCFLHLAEVPPPSSFPHPKNPARTQPTAPMPTATVAVVGHWLRALSFGVHRRSMRLLAGRCTPSGDVGLV